MTDKEIDNLIRNSQREMLGLVKYIQAKKTSTDIEPDIFCRMCYQDLRTRLREKRRKQ